MSLVENLELAKRHSRSSSTIDVASEKFSKPAELQQRVDLALIENELKKQQIAAQAKATTEEL